MFRTKLQTWALIDRVRSAGVILLIFVVTLPPTVRADKFAGDFMSVGGGARALGMGGAFAAIANDASTVFWNPAGMSGLEKRHALFMHSERFGDFIDYNFASFVSPTKSFVSADREAAFGIALIHMGIDDIFVTRDLTFVDVDNDGIFEPADGDRLNYDPDNLKKEANNDFALMGSFALNTTYGRIGGNLKLVYTDAIAGFSATGIGVDLGYLYRDVFPRLDVGVKLQDITGTFISWSSGHNEFIAPSVKIGTAYRIDLSTLNGSLLLAADGDVFFEDRRMASQFWADRYSLDVHVGAEVTFQEKVMIRGGIDTGNPTAGAGFRVELGSVVLGFDYAYLHYKKDDEDIETFFDDTNRISVLAEF
ncbi:MAG: PorV/PorQ family protein [Candidatus Krumholzibacteria bacterium]|nr:PorV/PorQ family protein [Candidatus Krumholzibacteria bacterium]